MDIQSFVRHETALKGLEAGISLMEFDIDFGHPGSRVTKVEPEHHVYCRLS
jgi:hypothetical protein